MHLTAWHCNATNMSYYKDCRPKKTCTPLHITRYHFHQRLASLHGLSTTQTLPRRVRRPQYVPPAECSALRQLLFHLFDDLFLHSSQFKIPKLDACTLQSYRMTGVLMDSRVLKWRHCKQSTQKDFHRNHRNSLSQVCWTIVGRT